MGKLSLKSQYNKLLKSAPQRRLECALTFEQFCEIVSHKCYYCRGFFSDAGYGYGIDRIDNCLGYVLDNCCSCCGTCNIYKGSLLTQRETKAAIRVIIFAKLEDEEREKVKQLECIYDAWLERPPEEYESFDSFVFRISQQLQAPEELVLACGHNLDGISLCRKYFADLRAQYLT